MLLNIIRLWQLCYKYLDSECSLQVSEKEIVKNTSFYRKICLDFTP